LLKDPVLRRFIFGSILAFLFVWMLIRYFNAEPELMMEYLLYSFLMVLLLMSGALTLFFIYRVLRRLLRKKN